MEENKTTEAQESKIPEATAEVKPETKAETKETPEKSEPSVQELMTEIARLKRAADKASSEASEFKKKYRESLSEVEKASMEKAEKEAAREEEFNQLRRENSINRLEKQYMVLGFTPDEAARMAIAETDNDQDAKIKIMSEVDGRKKKQYEAEFLASRPDVNVGGSTGNTVTKEQFDNMGPVELTKFKRANPAEYDRLNAM